MPGLVEEQSLAADLDLERAEWGDMNGPATLVLPEMLRRVERAPPLQRFGAAED